jgi:arginyl-tRNA synthetase
MTILENLKENIKQNIKDIFNIDLPVINLDLPPEEKLGDYAFPCFALAKELKTNPAEVASQLAAKFQNSEWLKSVQSIGPYLNLFVSDAFAKQALQEIAGEKNFGQNKIGQGQKILIEFSGPNTNKPQHVGHLRNDCLGQALVNIFRANGYKVMATNIINDRGIHIVKSMLAWQEFGQGETPKSSGVKGDHLVGKYYVKFGQVLAEERKAYYQKHNIEIAKLDDLVKRKIEDEFLAQSPWMQKAHAMLRAWENNDPAVKKLWRTMNSWVYEGYDKTYDDLGIKFDHLDFESDTYLLGKDLIQLGLEKKVFYKKDDGSVWIDLKAEGLDEKVVLRSDGTSVYVTQDLGTATRRYKKFKFAKAIYVVASEQEYHFKVLFLILKKLGFAWAEQLYHLSYGLVSLPGGRIKSREGQTAEADDLIADMVTRAQKIMTEAKKQASTTETEKTKIAKMVGVGALKFFMLGTNPQKNITFKPEESISFDGYTGTFIQYTHARMATLLKKADSLPSLKKLDLNLAFNKEEQKLIRTMLNFPTTLEKVVASYNPALLTQYLFDLAKTFNNFYQQHSVLQAADENLKNIRLHLCQQTKKILKQGLELLGIEVPEVM